MEHSNQTLRPLVPLYISRLSGSARRRPRGRSGWWLGAAFLLTSAVTAKGGAVLITRDSFIRATGVTAAGPAGKFDLSNGTNGFGFFADDVTNGGTPGVGVVTEAHQYSAPGVADNAFQGAFAEGSVRADLTSAAAKASAASHFDLVFKVIGSAANYEFGAAMGTSGGAGVTAELLNITGTPVLGGPVSPAAVTIKPIDVAQRPVFSTSLLPGLGDSATIDKVGVLQPGMYSLRLRADTSAAVGQNSAYYSINLTLSPDASGPAAVPLPPAAWSGLATVTLLAVYRLRKRRIGRISL